MENESMVNESDLNLSPGNYVMSQALEKMLCRRACIKKYVYMLVDYELNHKPRHKKTKLYGAIVPKTKQPSLKHDSMTIESINLRVRIKLMREFIMYPD